jgi:hypothetical protein
MPASGQKRIPDGIVLANGAVADQKSLYEARGLKGGLLQPGLSIESIAAYDIKPGAPEHPKGDANGYVLSVGGKRIYFAGVTECVPEVRALKNIDVAFMPMNIPVGRMTPKAAAECTKAVNPRVVYIYHYDQDFASRAVNPAAKLSDGVNRESPDLGFQEFANELKGTSIEFKRGTCIRRRETREGNHETRRRAEGEHGNAKPRKRKRNSGGQRDCSVIHLVLFFVLSACGCPSCFRGVFLLSSSRLRVFVVAFRCRRLTHHWCPR